MHVAVFSAKRFDREHLPVAAPAHALRFIEARLSVETAALADGCAAVALFVSDRADAATLEALSARGVRFVALRSAGFDHVDLAAARRLGIRVARVPGYSPYAIAEHAVAMMLALNRKLHRAWNRVREGNFALDGLMGFDMHGRTAAVVGTGRIGAACARILLGFGCRVLAFDVAPDPELSAAGVAYVPLERALAEADIVSLHVPLNAATRRLIDARAIAGLKHGAMLVNTSRGGLLDTRAAIDGLKSGRIGALGLDVYEHEAGLFFDDHSGEAIADDVFSRLLTFPNVLITGHQAFFTREAVAAIARATADNLDAFAAGRPSGNEVG